MINYTLTFSALCVECQIFYLNTTRHLFKTVIIESCESSMTEKCKMVYPTRIITTEKERWESHKIVSKIFSKLKMILKTYKITNVF